MNLEDCYYDFPETMTELEKQMSEDSNIFEKIPRCLCPEILRRREDDETLPDDEDENGNYVKYEFDIVADGNKDDKEYFDKRKPAFGWTEAEFEEIEECAKQSEYHELLVYDTLRPPMCKRLICTSGAGTVAELVAILRKEMESGEPAPNIFAAKKSQHPSSLFITATNIPTFSAMPVPKGTNCSSNATDAAEIDESTSLIGNGNNNAHYSESTLKDKDDSVSCEGDSGDEGDSTHCQSANEEKLPLFSIASILSTSFAYGCIMTTLFLITLPVECQRIETEHPTIPKSVALGCFVAIAGITQLISPFVGMLSDSYRPPLHFQLGQRMPYLCFGSFLSVIGLFGEYINSYSKLWLRYGAFFFCQMIGLNIVYAMMIAFIPDQVPHSQTGIANGILAMELVMGSLTGFGLFHFYFGGHVQDMYGLYICIVIMSTILTGLYAHGRDASRMEIICSRRVSLQEEMTRQQRQRQLILGPIVLLKTMIWDPIQMLDSYAILKAYTIDINTQHDFFVVTVSRLCYYCGSSVQTFFLYFLHDIIEDSGNAENAVAALAVVSQISGALFCYPVGYISDRLCNGRRKPFVYFACTTLGMVTFCMIFARSLNQMTILCFILGAANGSYLTMETSLAIDTLPDDSDGPGHAQQLGVWGVAAFVGSALGPMIGGPLLYLIGSRDANENQDYNIYGYAVVLSLATAYFMLSAISLHWVRKANV